MELPARNRYQYVSKNLRKFHIDYIRLFVKRQREVKNTMRSRNEMS